MLRTVWNTTTRKGAIAPYIEPHHIDVRAFLDLKKNSGEERHRAHDLFPALWLNDLFMERIKKDESWSLFDPYETSDLHELYGEEFEARYIEYENDDSIRREVTSAKSLWKDILRSYFESGSPFLTFKDTANKRNPNKHNGIIHSTNLCTEIFQNTYCGDEVVDVTLSNGVSKQYPTGTELITDADVSKEVSKLTSLDSFGDISVVNAVTKNVNEEIAVCNLMSVNLGRVNTRKALERVIPIATRMLDNVVTLNFYPTDTVRRTALSKRAIGLGLMGQAEMLAKRRIIFGTQEHYNFIDDIAEVFSYETIKASCELAAERGTYPDYVGSDWSKGILPIDTANEKALALTENDRVCDWEALRHDIRDNGMRNGYLMAIAPTSSISILTGTTQSIEPVFKRKWFEENLSGLIPVTAPNLNPDNWGFYKSAYEYDQRDLIKGVAVIQKWFDQGISCNVFITIDKASGAYLNSIYMTAWEYGLKSTYYLRSESPESKDEPTTEDRSQECVGCQ